MITIVNNFYIVECSRMLIGQKKFYPKLKYRAWIKEESKFLIDQVLNDDNIFPDHDIDQYIHFSGSS